MIMRSIFVGVILAGLGAAVGAAQWFGEGQVDERSEARPWDSPPRPSSPGSDTRSVLDRLSPHRVYAIAPPEAETGDEDPATRPPEQFPELVSIAVLGGRPRAFLSGSGSQAEAVATGDDILGWRITSISMKGVRVEKDGQSVLLKVFERTDIPPPSQ
jgi:hypothetical protein